jgi:hypothetical protein
LPIALWLVRPTSCIHLIMKVFALLWGPTTLHRPRTGVGQTPRLLNRNSWFCFRVVGTYLDLMFTFGNRVELELKGFIELLELGWELIPCSTKILKPKSNSSLVPICDFNQNQIGFLITIRFCFRFLSRDLLVNSQVCNIIFFHICEFFKTLVIP